MVNIYNLKNNHKKRYNELKYEFETYEIIYNNKRNTLIARNKFNNAYCYYSYGYCICVIDLLFLLHNTHSIHLNNSLWDYSRTTKMGLYKLFNDLFNVDFRQSDINNMIKNHGVILNGNFYKLYLFSDIEY